MWTYPLRDWQTDGHQKYIASLPQDALFVAVPGAGKTVMAHRLAHSLLTGGQITSVIVVAPSVALVEQWIESAHAKAGIELCALDTKAMANGKYPSDFHGVATTYDTMSGQLGQLALAKLVYTHHGQVLVVVDEIHHAATSLAWGTALENAFDSAAYRLLLSGTPFRTDGMPLPFIDYASDGAAIPFHTYTYAQALTDRVCRRIVFPKYDGQLEYWNGEEIIHATFRDVVSQEKARQRLKAAITSDWLDGVIQDAHERLRICRQNGHANAGGLIVCMNDYHAQKVAERVRRITGISPVVVTHREEEARTKIEAFAKSDAPWIVAIKMISEGVDIPRLRVGIYATNILTEIYFWQFCGRFIRMIPTLDSEQDAFVFIPSDPVLMSYAQEIYTEQERQLRQVIDRIMLSPPDENEPDALELLRYRSIYGTGTAEQDGAIFLAGIEVTRQEYRFACDHTPSHLQSETSLLAVILVMRSLGQPLIDQPLESPSATTKPQDSNARLRIAAMQEESELLKALHRRLLDVGKLTAESDVTKRWYAHFQASLNRLVGVTDKHQCSLEHLQQREHYIKQCIRSGNDAS